MASATAAQLVDGVWSTIPGAPLEARVGPSVVWTGTQLVVWGGKGEPSGRHERDGAAYTPATRTWLKLSPAPATLTPRSGAAAVWTGSEVVFWGGIGVQPPHRPTTGSVAAAAYTPATNSWQSLGPAPLPPTPAPVGIWTGDRVVFFSGADAASYDPADNQWQQLPTPASVHPMDGWGLAVGVGPGQILAWSGADELIDNASHSSYAITGDARPYRYDEATNHWTALPSGPKNFEPDEAYWTGDRALVRGYIKSNSPACCEEITLWYDPKTGRATNLAQSGGADPEPSLSVWTGDALVTTAPSVSGPSLGVVYDPTTNTSQNLPTPPLGQYGSYTYPSATPVWTGTSLIVFFYAQFFTQPAQANAIAGLEYTIR